MLLDNFDFKNWKHLPLDNNIDISMSLINMTIFQVAFYEIMSQMWVRNGLQIRGQAMTYIQCHFSNSMVDPDLLLLQICATRLNPSVFLKTILDRFHVKQWLSFAKKDR